MQKQRLGETGMVARFWDMLFSAAVLPRRRAGWVRAAAGSAPRDVDCVLVDAVQRSRSGLLVRPRVVGPLGHRLYVSPDQDGASSTRKARWRRPQSAGDTPKFGSSGECVHTVVGVFARRSIGDAGQCLYWCAAPTACLSVCGPAEALHLCIDILLNQLIALQKRVLQVRVGEGGGI